MQLRRGKMYTQDEIKTGFIFMMKFFIIFPFSSFLIPSSSLYFFTSMIKSCAFSLPSFSLNHGSITRFYYGMDQVALKAVPKSTTPVRDFLVEFHYSYFLSPHHGILDTYDVAFETPEYYVFAQEVAPLGDLWQVMTTFHPHTHYMHPYMHAP